MRWCHRKSRHCAKISGKLKSREERVVQIKNNALGEERKVAEASVRKTMGQEESESKAGMGSRA